MNHTLAIARRELAEKKFVLTAALALAAVVAIIPFLRGSSANWRSLYVVGSMILSAGFAAGLAVMLGVSIIGRELSDRRLSFYFTKPVAAPAIWFGKLIASALLVAGTFLIGNLPAVAAGLKEYKAVWSGGPQGLAILAIFFATIFFVAHVLSTIARSRSPWAAVDLVAATALGIVAWRIVQPLLSSFAWLMLLFVVKVFGWLLLIGVLAAGAWQLAMGRTDRLQSHRALSQFLWPAVATAIAICGAIVWWVVSATPGELTGEYRVHVSPRGGVALISGTSKHRRDYKPRFIMDLRNGDYERLMSLPLQQGFTGGGTKIVTIEPVVRSGAIGEVYVRDAALHAHARATGLIIGQHVTIAVSPDGNRIAYVTQGVLTIYDVPSRRSLGSVRMANPVRTMWFMSPDVVRVFQATPSTNSVQPHELAIFEYDLRSRAFTRTGSFQRPARYFGFTASSDGSRLFVRTDGHGVSVLDGRSAAVLMTLNDNVGWFRPLPEGRMIGSVSGGLRVFNAAGAVERDIPIGARNYGFFPVAADRVLVEAKTNSGFEELVVDVNSGSIVRRVKDLRPIDGDWFLYDGRYSAPSPDHLFIDSKGQLIRWNAITNERTVLVKSVGSGL